VTAGLLTWLLTGAVDASALEFARLCPYPNNLRSPHEAGEGFENRSCRSWRATWVQTFATCGGPNAGATLRNTLNAGVCDIVPGIADGIEAVTTTRPYYRSSYVFRRARRVIAGEPVIRWNDHRLANATIGVQLIGDDGANAPPAHALTRRGLISNVRGFMVYGD
jgi:mxaJ protein